MFLDLTDGGDTAWSRTEIRFRCREDGATTFADLDAVAVHELILNGQHLDPKAVKDRRITLGDLDAENTQVVDAWVSLSNRGSGLSQ